MSIYLVCEVGHNIRQVSPLQAVDDVLLGALVRREQLIQLAL